MTEENTKPGFAALLAMTTDQKQALQDAQPTDAEIEADLFGEKIEGRGPGRPKGAINKATKTTAELILATGQSPAMYLASVMRDVTADKERRDRAAIALMPFVHSKMPTAVDLTGAGGLLLQIQLGADNDAQQSGAGGDAQKPSLLDVTAIDVKSE